MLEFPNSFETTSNFDDNDLLFMKPLDEHNPYELDFFLDKNNDNDIYNGNDIFNFNSKDKRNTFDKTKKKNNIKENNPVCWTLDKIQNGIFDKEIYKTRFTSDIKSKLNINIQINEPFLNKKRYREEFTDNNDVYDPKDNNNNNQFKIETINKRGRKPKNEIGERNHNKKSADNIIKKVKSKLFKFCNYFINNILKEITSEIIIYDLDYKYINKLKKEKDLEYIKMPLKDLFSLDISPKFNDMKNDTNKINIQNLLSDNEDDTLKFCFNMTFGDWIDIFTYKKNVSELLSKYNDDNNNDIDVKKIEENVVGVDALLKKIAKKNKDDKYFSLFTFYLYNYELWFSSRKGRNRKQKE